MSSKYPNTHLVNVLIQDRIRYADNSQEILLIGAIEIYNRHG
jgi:hypothetical protein